MTTQNELNQSTPLKFTTNISNNSLNNSENNSSPNLPHEVFINRTIYQLKIILVGDSSVGKTSLVNRFMGFEFQENYSCTINADFKIKSITVDELSSAQITIWDTCGQERYRAITRGYFKDAHGILLIFDVADKRSFSDLDIWLEEIKKNTVKEDISIILIGNKIDLKYRTINTEAAKNFAKNNGLMYCETSCKEGKNIEMAFEMITKDIINKQNKNIFADKINDDIKIMKGKEKKREKEISCC